jgi:tetratricopeptide (TPR) repeat protein
MVLFLLINGVSSLRAAEDDEELSAKEAYERGAEYFEQENFEKAAEYFQRAVDKEPNAILHYNLAQARAKLGEWISVVEQTEKAEAAGELGGEVDAINQATLAGARTVLAARAVLPPRTPSDDGAGPGPPLGLSAIGWSGTAGAVAGGGMLVGSLLIDNSLSDDFRDRDSALASGDQDRARSIKDRINRKQTTGQVLLYGGAGLAAAGIGTVVFDLMRDDGSSRKTAARLGIRPFPNGAGVLFQIDRD